MAIKGVLRNIVYVEDMQKMVISYRDVLQPPLNYPHKADYSNEFWVEFQAGSITIALHAGGKSGKKPSAPKIVFEVDDIEAERSRLLAAGVDIRSIENVAPSVRSADGFDIEGNYFSIVFTNTTNPKANRVLIRASAVLSAVSPLLPTPTALVRSHLLRYTNGFEPCRVVPVNGANCYAEC
jgi:hypothetical protein